MVTTAVTGERSLRLCTSPFHVFKYQSSYSLLVTFRLPLLPTAPALAPAAGASPGGLEGKLAGPDPPGSGDVGVQEMPEVASLALPRPGCIEWVVVRWHLVYSLLKSEA